MDRLLEVIYGTLIRPSTTFEKLVQEPLSLFIPALIGVMLLLLNIILGFSLMGGPELVRAMMVPAMFGTLFFLLTMAAVFHMVAALLGGKGDVTTLFMLLCFSQVPRIFLPSASMASTLPGSLGLLTSFLMTAAISVWSFFLSYLAIQKTYRFSGEKAFLTLILPGLLIFFLIVTLFWGTFSGLSRMF